MKKTYKLLCFLMVLILLIGTIPVSASEFTPPETLYYGDVDFDEEVTIKDATLIQKYIAQLESFTTVQRFLADSRFKGITISTVTEIQKYLAGYEINYYIYGKIGEQIKETADDTFTDKISLSCDFEQDTILVNVDTRFGYYTLEDFPEYNFKSIDQIGDIDRAPLIYVLTLEEPSKENVIDAISSLNYRANIDLLSASPNYIYTIA